MSMDCQKPPLDSRHASAVLPGVSSGRCGIDPSAEPLLARALQCASEGVLITDTSGIILYANEAFTTVTGYPCEEVVGKTPAILKSGRTPREVYRELWATISRGERWEGRILNRRRGGDCEGPGGERECPPAREFWARLAISPVWDSEGEVCAYIAIQRDISEIVESESRRDFERKEATLQASVLKVLQERKPLLRRVEEALDLVMNLEELEIQAKSGVFVRPEGEEYLEMLALHGEFSQEFIEKERRIPLGACLCGRAAVGGELLISDDCHCDPRHEHVFEGMSSHGHYIVPLRAGGEILGVLFLYTSPYPSRSEHRLSVLRGVGDALALALADERIRVRLINSRQAAQKASEAKSRFLATMSHEIRTPLNGILGFASLLRKAGTDVSEEERSEWLSMIERSGGHLLRIINDILDLSKVESDEMEFESISCSALGIPMELASIMRPKAAEKGLSLDVSCDGALPETITTDPTRLRQILTNLVGNAVKFTSEGGVHIALRLVEEKRGCGDSAQIETMLEFEVEDTGCGIPDSRLDAVFEPFTQADSSVVREFGGTGLGLTISRRFAEALGGSLSVRSVKGSGTVFSLRVPTGPLDDVEFIQGFESYKAALTKKKGMRQGSRGGVKGSILVADDGVTNQRLIRLILERAGAEVACANDGKEAVEAASRRDFGVILMDMHMPGMDGYTATRLLRTRGVQTPIVALTASAMRGDREKCLAVGCTDYMTKPVDPDGLLDLVRTLLGGEGNGESAEPSVEPLPAQSQAISSTLPMDDPDFREIAFDYVQQLREKVVDMCEARQREDHKAVMWLAHWLKGSGGTAGYHVLSDPAKRLEQAAGEGSGDQIDAILEEIGLLVERIVAGTGDCAVSGCGSREGNACPSGVKR